MSDARDYVPDEWLVRATLSGTRGDTLGDARDDPGDAWDVALDYVPPEPLVRRVVAWSARPAFRLRLLDAPRAAARRAPSLTARAAASLGAWGLSPGVLAAAVVLHAALGVAIGVGLGARGTTWPSAADAGSAGTEHVVAVVLPPVASPGELAVSVGQSIDAVPVRSGLSRQALARLDTTVRVLGRYPAARLTLESDTAGRAIATAELVQAYLVQRGVARARVPIAVRARAQGGVTVSLDSAADLRR